METNSINKTKLNLDSFFRLKKDEQYTIYFTIAVMLFISMLRFINFYLFHSVVEIYSSIISIGIFMFAFNTYGFTKNDFFMLLGIGYLFVGMLDLCHAFSYESMNIFPVGLSDMPPRFWLVARVFELVATLVSLTVLIKNIKTNHLKVFIVYFALFALVVLDIIYFNIIPACNIKGHGQTQFKLICEYIIIFGFVVSIVLFSKYKDLLDSNMFFYIIFSLIIKVIYEIFISLFLLNTDFNFLIAHILKVFSFYLMYKGIIVNGLKRPFDVLIYNLNKKEKQRAVMEESILHNAVCTDLVLNHSSDGMIVHSSNCKILYANSTAMQIFGVDDVSDLIGKDILENIEKDSIINLKHRFSNIISYKANSPFELTKFILKDGKTAEVETSSAYIIYDEKPAILTIFRGIVSQEKILSLKEDIVESEKKLEESNEYNRILSEFFTNISHELKTPLNIILGSVQLLIQKNLTATDNSKETPENILNILKQNTYRLIRLVNNIVDISKYDSGFLMLTKHNHNIVSITEEISFSVSQYFKSRGVNIIFDTDTEEKIMAIDDDKIERILLNLLSNAIKFTDEGGEILVNISDIGESVIISVKDTGTGIPADKLEFIFERYGQVDKTLARNKEGSGIGLSLVRSLVEMHDGKISVKSKLGEGSEFIIELPVTLIQEETIIDSNMNRNKIDKFQIEFSDIYS